MVSCTGSVWEAEDGDEEAEGQEKGRKGHRRIKVLYPSRMHMISQFGMIWDL